jgi:ubiquinone/menaquinone biosynthesis C-methylase UbiE
MNYRELNRELGNIDLYWLDFILKGYLPEMAKILDAGCGEGRNLQFCMKNGMDVFGIDQNPEAIGFLKRLAKQYGLENVEARFQTMKLDHIRYPDSTFDVLICSAVLHFAENKDHFDKMIQELSRVLKPRGRLFIRAMTDHYFSPAIKQLDTCIFQFENDQIRFVLNADTFLEEMHALTFKTIEPYKEVIVNKRYTMGSFMFEKF